MANAPVAPVQPVVPPAVIACVPRTRRALAPLNWRGSAHIRLARASSSAGTNTALAMQPALDAEVQAAAAAVAATNPGQAVVLAAIGNLQQQMQQHQQQQQQQHQQHQQQHQQLLQLLNQLQQQQQQLTQAIANAELRRRNEVVFMNKIGPAPVKWLLPPPAHAECTVHELDNLPAAEVNPLLVHYGLPLLGNLAARCGRLQRHLGAL